jgi:glucose-6-phosphate 1-dehydrogenase
MTVNQPLQSAIVVIFGGEGDLTWRKLICALFTLPHIRYLGAIAAQSRFT